MFYPVESLKRGGRFYLCWVADSWPLRFATITHRQLWSQDIRKICDDLLEVMTSESGRTKNRFSLRLSSQLMRGLVRLYQRKVTVFVGDLCMINAIVMKSTHKHTHTHETTIRQELPSLVFEEPVDDDKIEERIRNSGNTVAHVQDITMNEPILPENRMFLDDNFGEIHPDQNIQLLVDRSVEMMLVQDSSAPHHSGLLPDTSADRSHDQSHLAPLDPQMQRISEHDISVFRKSVGEALTSGVDFDKEIPEIPDIPPPDLHAPTEKLVFNERIIYLYFATIILIDDIRIQLQLYNFFFLYFFNSQKEQTLVVDTTVSKANDTIQNEQEKTLEEIVLEELDEPQVKKRKLKSKLIIDKKTQLSSNFLRSRIANINVELRCEDSLDDIIKIYPTSNILLNRAAHCGSGIRSNLGYKLAHMFARNLGTGFRQPVDDVEEAVGRQTRQSHMRSLLEKIDEEAEPAEKVIEPIHHEIQDISKEINITGNIQNELQVAPGQEVMDISDLPTQRILRTSQADDINEPAPKRQRRSGYVSYRLSQQLTTELSNIESNKENIIDFEKRQQDAERLTAMLVEAGLADIQEQERPTETEAYQVTVTQKSRRNGSDTSETPLGSLDRTKVSLGDSEKTTDSRRFIREEWGTQGTMYKIYKCIKKGVKPLDLHYLINRGPTIAGHRRVIAARCFSSILKLKQHGFITVIKHSNTNEIKDISLGSKIITSKRHDY
ncbi:uncharacterized protein LOC123655815 [Melitaea cinxia]|uniref:uncharacterized protein LOC123655815 n=1 Tax=Melitaea cinxia TaxID=113334 RepID=UPI001E2737DB|nr:uncharacterized protein LOC123655815 [Melitaea cinxia]